ncbi:MAG: hypothetical protein ACI9MC_001644 [Kiritimatiellia bacterium]|jgi:hypothetical protein
MEPTMNAYQDPSDVPELHNSRAPDLGWEEEMAIVAPVTGVTPSLPPELRERPPADLEELPLDDDPTESVAIVTPEIAAPGIAVPQLATSQITSAEISVPADSSAPKNTTASKKTAAPNKPREKRRGLAIVGVIVGGLALLGVVAVAGLVVVGVAGVGGAMFLYSSASPMESSPATLAAPVVERVELEAVVADVVAPSVVGVPGAHAAPEVAAPYSEDEAGTQDEPASPAVSSTVEAAPSVSRPSTTTRTRQTSPPRGPAEADVKAVSGSDEVVSTRNQAVSEEIVHVKDGEAKFDVAAAGRALTSGMSKKTSSFSVRGDGVQVHLLKGSKRVRVPGDVQAGRYDIEATFDGQDPVVVGSIRVRGGESFSVSCDSSVGSCSAE